MANTAGKATATTLLIPLRRGWALWCRALFAAAARFSAISAPLRRQSFIHVAHWTLTDRLDGHPLGHTCLYFESNFDGSMDEYVDVFEQAVPWRMRMIWAGGLDYPGLFPGERYRQWSEEHANHVQHYYAGYEDATTTEVMAALEVDRRLDGFARAHDPAMSDDEFDRGYRRLLEAVAPWL
jgi:hypothetical protein